MMFATTKLFKYITVKVQNPDVQKPDLSKNWMPGSLVCGHFFTKMRQKNVQCPKLTFLVQKLDLKSSFSPVFEHLMNTACLKPDLFRVSGNQTSPVSDHKLFLINEMI